MKKSYYYGRCFSNYLEKPIVKNINTGILKYSPEISFLNVPNCYKQMAIKRYFKLFFYLIIILVN